MGMSISATVWGKLLYQLKLRIWIPYDLDILALGMHLTETYVNSMKEIFKNVHSFGTICNSQSLQTTHIFRIAASLIRDTDWSGSREGLLGDCGNVLFSILGAGCVVAFSWLYT